MDDLPGKSVCVIGLGASGRAAVELLLAKGVKVTAVDSAESAALMEFATVMRERGVECHLGHNRVLPDAFDLAVVSPGVPLDQPQIASLQRRGIPVWGELELGWRESDCLAIGITGTNGKTTTTELVSTMLTQNQRRTVAAGNIGTPLSAVAGQTRELDVVTLEVSSFQLETIVSFRPNLAVLLNLAPDHLDRHGSMENYIRAKARLFENQKPFDRAIIQWDAWQELQRLGIKISSKVITFSVTVQVLIPTFGRITCSNPMLLYYIKSKVMPVQWVPSSKSAATDESIMLSSLNPENVKTVGRRRHYFLVVLWFSSTIILLT